MWIKRIDIVYVYCLLLVLSNLAFLQLVKFISFVLEPVYNILGGIESLIVGIQIANYSKPIILVFIFSPIAIAYLYYRKYIKMCQTFHIISIYLYFELLLFAFLLLDYYERFARVSWVF